MPPPAPAQPTEGPLPRGRRRQARGDRTRAQLVAAATALFGAHGVEDVSIDQITSAADVAKGTFYVHFQRKTDVLLELAAQLVDHVAPEPATGSLRGDLDAIASDLAASLAVIPRPMAGRMVREIVGNPLDWHRVLDGRPALRELIRPTLDRAVTEGRVRADISTRRLAQQLTILWLDTVVGWAERPQDQPLDVELALATAVFVDGAAR